MQRTILTSTLLAFSATLAMAAEPNPQVQSYLDAQILPWAQNEVLVGAINAQNERTHGFGPDEIDALDQTWRAEVGTGSSELVDGVLMNAASDFLREHVAASGGMITEVFIMDAQGLNVAASGPTSDYWQGDEAKFQETYPHGAGAVHVSDIEFDESSQAYQAQVSITLTDPATGAPIGAMTVGIDAEALM